MQARAGTNATLFVAGFFLLVAWRFAPEWGDPWQLWVLVVLFAGGGTEAIVRAHRRARRIRGPRPAPLTPPVWLIAWLAIGALAWTYGTPHLRIVYGPEGCFYAGWNGWQRQGTSPCPVVTMLRPGQGT